MDWLKAWAALGPFVGGLITAVIMWRLNQHAKLAWESRLRKEDRYLGFLNSLKGFYVSSASPEAKRTFLSEWQLAWLYCPDNVMRRANEFLDAVKVKQVKSTDQEKEAALAAFVLELRRDLLGKTSLSAADYNTWVSTGAASTVK